MVPRSTVGPTRSATASLSRRLAGDHLDVDLWFGFEWVKLATCDGIADIGASRGEIAGVVSQKGD